MFMQTWTSLRAKFMLGYQAVLENGHQAYLRVVHVLSGEEPVTPPRHDLNPSQVSPQQHLVFSCTAESTWSKSSKGSRSRTHHSGRAGVQPFSTPELFSSAHVWLLGRRALGKPVIRAILIGCRVKQ